LTNKGKVCYYRRFSGFGQHMSAFVIDGFEFCRRAERREGEVEVAGLTRLAAELVNKAGMLRWALQGGADSRGNPQLTLSVKASVQLRCQRCLAPIGQEIDSESVLVLAKDEESADEIDALLADEEVEVIVGSKSLDTLVLIEDEALLALPLSPRHATCPDHSGLEMTRGAKAESPFAVLKNLKKQ
jgi:uncharacterized protein